MYTYNVTMNIYIYLQSQSRAKLRDLLKKFKNDIKDHGKPIPIFVKKGSIPDSPGIMECIYI